MGSLSSPHTNGSRSGSQMSSMFPKLPHTDSPGAASTEEKPLLYSVSLKNSHNTLDPKPHTIPPRQKPISTGDSPLQTKSVRFAPGVKFVSQENRTVPLRRLPKVIPYKTGPTRGSSSEPSQHQLPNINAEKSTIVGTNFLGDATKALPINGRGGAKAPIQSTLSTTERQLHKLHRRHKQIRWRETTLNKNTAQSYVNMKRFSVKGHHIDGTGNDANGIYGSSAPLLPRRMAPVLYSGTTTEKRTFASGMILQLLTREPTNLSVSGNCISGKGTHSVDGRFLNLGNTSPKPNKKWGSANRAAQFHEKFADMYRVPANMSSAFRRDVWNTNNGGDAFMHMVSPRSVTNSTPVDISLKVPKLKDRT